MNVPIYVVNENAIHMCGHVLYLNEPKWSPYKQYTNSNPAMDLFTMLVWGACSCDRVMWSTCDWVMWSSHVINSCVWVMWLSRDQVMWSTWSNHVIESCDNSVKLLSLGCWVNLFTYLFCVLIQSRLLRLSFASQRSLNRSCILVCEQPVASVYTFKRWSLV